MEDTSTVLSEQKIATNQFAGQYVHQKDPLFGIDAAIDQPGGSNNLTEPELEPEASLSNQFAPHDALRYFKIRAYWYKKHLRCTKKKVRYNCR